MAKKEETSYILQPHEWLVDAFGPIVQASEPKRHLFKLLEFNKVEVLRSARLKVPISKFEHDF